MSKLVEFHRLQNASCIVVNAKKWPRFEVQIPLGGRKFWGRRGTNYGKYGAHVCFKRRALSWFTHPVNMTLC